jgi:hypothetical protein
MLLVGHGPENPLIEMNRSVLVVNATGSRTVTEQLTKALRIHLLNVNYNNIRQK